MFELLEWVHWSKGCLLLRSVQKSSMSSLAPPLLPLIALFLIQKPSYTFDQQTLYRNITRDVKSPKHNIHSILSISIIEHHSLRLVEARDANTTKTLNKKYFLPT